MKKTYSTFQVVFLSVLLFHTPQTSQEKFERHFDESEEVVKAKSGKGSLSIRDLLSAATLDDASAHETAMSNDDLSLQGQLRGQVGRPPSPRANRTDTRPPSPERMSPRLATGPSPEPRKSPSQAMQALLASVMEEIKRHESQKITTPPSTYSCPFSERYPACVKGVDFYKENFVICRDYFGIPVHMSECNPTKETWTGSYTMCPQDLCDGDWSVELKAWTPCPESCTTVLENGTIVLDTVDRPWTCQPNSETMGNADEDCKPLIKESGLTLERECPLKPCKEYTMQPSSWGICDCKTWTQERSFHCIDNAAANGEHPLEACENYGLKRGATSRKCLPKTKCQNTKPAENEDTSYEDPFDLCNYFNCSTHGTCKDSVCSCEDGFFGVDCQSYKRVTPECEFPSILQGNGTCCESGIYNYNGHCCTGDHAELQLDKNGDCCFGQLDLCGNCNPEELEFRDIRGTCCKVLDAGGFCCPSGKVDECGVCDGLGLTCNTTVSINFKNETIMNEADNCTSALIPKLAEAMWVGESSIEAATVDKGCFTFTATGVIVSSGLLMKKADRVARAHDIEASCGSFVNLTVDRSPKCRNKVCEIRESTAKSVYHCEEDCTYEIARCEVTKDELGRPMVCNGHGSCSFKGVAGCECFEGYAGSNCELCQYGFFHVDEEGSICLPRQAYINSPSYDTLPSPELSPVASPFPSAIPSPVGKSEEETIPPSLYFGPFSDCHPKCVSGVDFYKERFVICRDYLGIPVHMSECAPTKDFWLGSYIRCPQYTCDEAVSVELTGWESCPNTCTEVTKNGTIVPDHVAQYWLCITMPYSVPVKHKFCQSLVAKLGLRLIRECPLKPCRDYRIEPSIWKKCDCDAWTQERKNLCNHDHEKKARAPLETCQNFGLKLLYTTRRCLPKYSCNSSAKIDRKKHLHGQLFDFCDACSCSTHGTCKNSHCHCDKGFFGNDCQWGQHKSHSKCVPPSIFKGDGTCCVSGIYNYTGHCCLGNNKELQLDKNGDCCNGELDMCGNCNPVEPEFRDTRGTCCKVLDAGGFCCPSGNVDECGVCDGLSLTCKTILNLRVRKEMDSGDLEQCKGALRPKVAIAMRVRASAIHQETLEEGSKFMFSATGVVVSSGLLTEKVRTLTRNIGFLLSCGYLVNFTVYRSAECGNSFCEIGEASPESEFHCPEDCTYEIARCPLSKDRFGRLVVCSGHGSCSFREEAKCMCFEGYTGSNCDQCQFGFSHLGEEDSRCLPRQAYLNGPSPSMQGKIFEVQ